MPTLTPFLYGKPVPPKRFVGREDAVRTIFSRLGNGESTAIVGEPHIGKSSLLNYLLAEDVRREWLTDSFGQYVFVDMDCQMMPAHCQPTDFWRQVLTKVRETATDADLVHQCDIVLQNQFGTFTLEGLFKLLARKGWRVVLLIDEFDTLLGHPNFNKAEFFGALRSLATRTEGLAVITASRLSMSQMNRQSQEINPFGSPFFNNFTEVRLLPFSPEEVLLLLRGTLKGGKTTFTKADVAYLQSLAGRHPFLVQVAATGLFDATVTGKTGEARYQAAGQFFHDKTAAHFDDFWHYLTSTKQTVLTILALGELKGQVDGRYFNIINELGRMEWYRPELDRLREMGMVEETGQRVASRGFVWWLADNVVARTRDTVGLETWLRDRELQGLLTRGEVNKLRDIARAIPVGVVSGAVEAVKLLLFPGTK